MCTYVYVCVLFFDSKTARHRKKRKRQVGQPSGGNGGRKVRKSAAAGRNHWPASRRLGRPDARHRRRLGDPAVFGEITWGSPRPWHWLTDRHARDAQRTCWPPTTAPRRRRPAVFFFADASAIFPETSVCAAYLFQETVLLEKRSNIFFTNLYSGVILRCTIFAVMLKKHAPLPSQFFLGVHCYILR